MPAIVNHRVSRVSSRGFTLIEILVVIVIVSVIIASVTIAVGVLGKDRQVEDQARRFWAVMQQAREESELQGLDLGVYLSAGAYEFLRLDQRRFTWFPIPDDNFFAERELPEGLRFRAVVDSREIVLDPDLPQRTAPPTSPLKSREEQEADEKNKDNDSDDEDEDNPGPQIILLSSGEIAPFEVTIERDNTPGIWRVVGLADGDLRVEQRDENSRWQVVLQTRQTDEEDEGKSNARK